MVRLLRTVAFAVGVVASTVACDGQAAFVSCDTEVFAEVPSPAGVNKAVLFSRDCGATTAEEIQVAIVEADESVGDRLGTTVFSSRVLTAPDQVTVVWQNGNALLIVSADPSPRIAKPQISIPNGMVVTVEVG